MIRTKFVFFFFSLLVAISLKADTGRPLAIEQNVRDNVVQTPEQLRRVPPPSPDWSVQALEERGDTLRVEKNYLDALDYYREALKHQKSAVIENKAGIAELQLLHHNEAKKRFEKAIKLDPHYPEAHNNLGVVFYIRRNFRKAIKEYSKAIELRTASSSYHSNLGTAYFSQKQYDKASLEYTRALELDPEVFNRQSSSGVSLSLLKPQERAKFNYTIARMFATRGDATQTILYLRRAIEDGFTPIESVYTEAAFAPLLKDPRFVSLMQSKPQAVK